MLSKKQADAVAEAILLQERVRPRGTIACPACHAETITANAKRCAFLANIVCPDCAATLRLKWNGSLAIVFIFAGAAELLVFGYLCYQVFYRHQFQPAYAVAGTSAAVAFNVLITTALKKLPLVQRKV